MINLRGKKKGASLLIVVAMMSILSILIISILAMTTSGYKLKIKENRRMENFYGADSGLEISEKILYEYTKAAVAYSNEFVDKANVINKLSIKEKQELFKKFFIEFFLNGGQTLQGKDFFEETPSTLPYNYRKSIEEIAEKRHYKKFARDNVEITKSKLSYKKVSPSTWEVIDSTNIADIPVPGTVVEHDKATHLRVHIESTYKEKEVTRVVAVDFDIEIPPYGKEIITSETAKAPRIFDYIFGADGDYKLSVDNTATIYGDLWIKGDDINEFKVDNKYSNGLKITSEAGTNPDVTLNGGLATGGTLGLENIKLTTDAANNKDIYANNFIVKNDNNLEMTTALSNSDIFLYNDFVMNGKINNVQIGNYYGLNDINNYENTPIIPDKVQENKKKADRSSAMIINSSDFGAGSSLTTNQAYILGTSYVDIGDGYQTGYSNSVNQLTKPYTVRDDKYVYDYKGDLQVIDGNIDGSQFDIQDKIEIATNYNLKDDINLAKGFTSSTLFNTGVILANNKVNPRNIPVGDDFQTTVKEKKKEYVNEVFNMGEKKPVSENDFEKKQFTATVGESFNWRGITEITKKDFAATDDNITKIAGNNNGLIDLQMDKQVTEIMHKAYFEPDLSKRPNLAAYGFAGSVELPRIIFNSTDKNLEIKEVKTTDSNAKKILESDDGKSLIYYMPLNDPDNISKPPVLIISNSDIYIKPLSIYNYMMMITTDNIEIDVAAGKPGATIGNFSFQSSDGIVPGYAGGQYNFINELFKYILEDSELMGDIGNDIFIGSAQKEVRESVQIADLVNRSNWKVIK